MLSSGVLEQGFFCSRVVDIICNSVRSLTFDSGGAAVMAMAIDILAKLLRW